MDRCIRNSRRGLRKPRIQCDCTETAKEPLSASAGCSDDLAAVSALPKHWEPRHCGPTLINYLKEREQNHNKLLEDLMSDAAKVNDDIDAKISQISEILLSHVKENQHNINCVTQVLLPDERVLSAEARNEALMKITKLFTIRVQDLTKFKQEAFGVERERADGMRNIMNNQFQRLMAVGHQTPKALLDEFDDRIYEINQQLLSNCRAYIELEAQLKVQLDESIVHARSVLNQLCFNRSKIVRGQSALPWMKNSHSFHKRSDSADCKNVKESRDLTDGVLANFEEFKVCVSQLVESYRNAILKIFSGFSCQLDDLHKNIGTQDLKADKSQSDVVTAQLQNMIDHALKRISDSSVQAKSSIYKDLEEMAQNDVLHLQRSLSTLGKCLRETYRILFDASHLWDGHILRSALVQKLTIAALEDIQNINDTAELANEIHFDIMLEQVRYAPDVDKLQQYFDGAMNLLKHIEDMNLQHSESEIAKLEEYMNLPSTMANVLLAECNVFIENHPKTILEASGSVTSPANGASPNPLSAHSLRAPLPRAIFQTELQEVALNNWKNGFLDSFVYNLPSVSEELHRQARKWVDERSLQLNMRYSLKLMSHGIRGERLKAAREARSAELRFHEQRLDSHLNAIYERIEELPIEASTFLTIDAPELYPFSKWIISMQSDLDNLISRDPSPEVKKLKMMSYAPRLVKHKKLFQESLDVAIEEYKKNLETEIQVAKTSNFQFMSQLKLFYEAGRYAAGEATKTCATLLKAADALEACKQRSSDAVNVRRTQLLALADLQAQPLQRIVDEVSRLHNEKKSAKKK